MSSKVMVAAPVTARWPPALADWLDPVAAALRDLAPLHPGARVPLVDFGAGDLGLGAALAARVGEMGNLAPPLAPPRPPDALAASGDIALALLGLGDGQDPGRALVALRRALVPGERAVVAGFSLPRRNLAFALPLEVARRHARRAPPPPEAPGPPFLGAPDALAALLRAAGFCGVATQAGATTLRLPSASECAALARAVCADLDQTLAKLPAAERAAADAEIARALGRFAGPAGFAAPVEFIVGTGVRPGRRV